MKITQASPLRKAAKRRKPLSAIVVHTTGTGIVQAAKDGGTSAISEALKAYQRQGAPYPHAVIDERGAVTQVADFGRIAWHAGITEEQRALYESGRWRQRVALDTLARWDARWPGKRGPLDVVAGPWNETTIGIELIPTGSAKFVGAQNVYTLATLAALRELVAHLRGLYGAGLLLVGHEDLEPLERWDARGGWDPGALREDPWFRWEGLR